MTEPCDLTAVEARRLIGQKALSPVELTDSCIGRIEAVDGRFESRFLDTMYGHIDDEICLSNGFCIQCMDTSIVKSV